MAQALINEARVMANIRKFLDQSTKEPVYVNSDIVRTLRVNVNAGTDIFLSDDQMITVEQDVETVVRSLNG